MAPPGFIPVKYEDAPVFENENGDSAYICDKTPSSITGLQEAILSGFGSCHSLLLWRDNHLVKACGTRW